MITKLRPIKSFVLRQGRMTEAQRAAFERLAQLYCLSAEGLNTFLTQNQSQGKYNNIALEIGFGMGDALLYYAKAQPETLWLGIEVHTPGVGRVLNEMDKAELTNIRIVQDDALEVLKHAIPNHSLNCVHLFFPDPWPKARHHKRRIVNADFIQLVSQKLQPSGILHMATDWENYAEWMREAMANHSGFTLKNENRNNRPLTKFEQRGIKLGHAITDLYYEKT